MLWNWMQGMMAIRRAELIAIELHNGNDASHHPKPDTPMLQRGRNSRDKRCHSSYPQQNRIKGLAFGLPDFT
jgi:hypothetical protein